jgi:hypothetical protein
VKGEIAAEELKRLAERLPWQSRPFAAVAMRLTWPQNLSYFLARKSVNA